MPDDQDHIGPIYLYIIIIFIIYYYFIIFKCLNIFHLNQIFSAEERGCERAAGDVADLQAHEAGQAHHPLQGANTPAQVPTRHLRVSLSYILHVTCYILHLVTLATMHVSTTISL